MRRILLLLIFLTCTIVSYGQSTTPASQYTFERKSTDAGFTYNDIRSIVNDKNNMIWCCCDNGLYYYNNREFTHYTHNPDDIHSIPSNDVRHLFCDSNNRLWVVTNWGLCYYDSPNDRFIRIYYGEKIDRNIDQILEYKKSQYLTTVNGKLYTFDLENVNEIKAVDCPTKSPISTLYKNDGKAIYLGCENGELYTLNTDLQNQALIYSDVKSNITSICQSYNRLYIGYIDQGVNQLNLTQEGTVRYRLTSKDNDTKLPSNNVKCINKCKNGDIWIGTNAGVVVITPNYTTTIKATPYNQLSRNSIYAIHVDKNDDVWLGTWAGNLIYYSPSNYRFRINRGNKTNITDPGFGRVHHFAPNDEETTWVGGEWTGLSLLNHKSNQYVHHYRRDLHIKCLERDENGDVWIGSILQGLHKFDNKTKKIEKIATPFDSKIVLPAIAIDRPNNTVWVGSRGSGLLAYNTKTKKSTVYNSQNTENFISNDIWDLELHNGELLICTNNGFSIRDKNGKFTTYDLTPASKSMGRDVFSSCVVKKSNIAYITTKENGIKILNLKTKKISDFEKNDAIKKSAIYNAVIDSKNHLWLTSNNGIYSYNPANKRLKHFTKVDGLENQQLHPGSCSISPNDILYCGTTTGVHYINTRQIKEDKIEPNTFISGIAINNVPLDESNCLFIDSKHFTDTKRIDLGHDNNSITFSFTSNNSLKCEKGQFKYRFIGYQDKWVTTKNNFATFTRMPFGQYKFEIASCNSDGVWGESNVIDVHIAAPLYLRWYAILLYIILVTLIACYLIQQAAFKIKAKKDIEVEREINVINSRTFDEKVKFFMNISHELRTPLALIKAPLNMLEHETTSKESMSHISTIKRNTERLLHLTNQILDFRLLEVNKLEAQRSNFDLVKLCDEVLPLFEYPIKDKGINFSLVKSSEYIPVALDRDMISKIIYNLVSNALKYSEDGGSISVSVANTKIEKSCTNYDIRKGEDVVGNAVVITIEDNGMGINKEHLPHIFERFYFNPNKAYSSSGIGLHMCMEYANLHNGNISVSSKEGEGTKFTVTLPIEEVTASEEKSITTTLYQSDNKAGTENEADIAKNSNKSKVLIVDDNSEIRFYLKKILGRSYNCITAKNGLQGYELAAEVKPDIIILDVLMPVMDGVECAQKLRENDNTKYIPIVMLSGITDDNNIVQGVKAGADAYMSKPINERLLFTHIESLTKKYSEREKRTKVSSTSAVAPSTNSSFAEKIEEIMEANIQNNSLDVNLIADEMSISRSTLHRNFKRELNMGVAEYIRDYRLNRAVQYMKNGVFNIDELSVCVGFNSSSYFCKAFKDKYGISPKKYYDSLQ